MKWPVIPEDNVKQSHWHKFLNLVHVDPAFDMFKLDHGEDSSAQINAEYDDAFAISPASSQAHCTGFARKHRYY